MRPIPIVKVFYPAPRCMERSSGSIGTYARSADWERSSPSEGSFTPLLTAAGGLSPSAPASLWCFRVMPACHRDLLNKPKDGQLPSGSVSHRSRTSGGQSPRQVPPCTCLPRSGPRVQCAHARALEKGQGPAGKLSCSWWDTANFPPSVSSGAPGMVILMSFVPRWERRCFLFWFLLTRYRSGVHCWLAQICSALPLYVLKLHSYRMALRNSICLEILSSCVWFSSFSCDVMFQIQYVILGTMLTVFMFMTARLAVLVYPSSALTALRTQCWLAEAMEMK